MATVMSLDDRDAIREVATRFFADRAPLSAQHAAARERPEVPRALLAEMAELDFFAQSAPESAGGLGLSALAAGLIAEAAGRELVPGPWLDQLVAVRMAAGSDEVVAPLMAAEALASVQFGHEGGGLRLDREAGTVSGRVRGLRFGGDVDRWVLTAAAGDGDGAAVVVVDPAGAETAEERAIDPLWRSVSATLTDAPVLAVVAGDAEDHYAFACGLAAATSVGAAQRLLEDAVAYVKDRRQFGRPVGAFQAIKHRAANCHIALVHARSLAHGALERGDAHAMRVARIAADTTYRLVAENALQMHGGIGFTAESTVHLFLKQAQQLRSWPAPVGAEHDHVRRRLGLDDPIAEARA